MKVGHQLLLGERQGYLQAVHISKALVGNPLISSTHKFIEAGDIHDVLAINDTHFLLAAALGLLRTTKDQIVKHSFKGQTARALCPIADSLYLVGFVNENVIKLWNEQTD